MSCYTEQKWNRQACLDSRDKLLYQPKLVTGDWREKRLEGLGLGVRVNKSKTNTAHNLLCFVLWCVLAFSKLFHWTTYVILCGLKALSVLPSFPLVLPSTRLKWHIRMIWTKENTSLLYSTTRGHLNHTRWTFERRHKHSAQTPIVLSNFKATKWMDLKPLLVVNTSSHVNNVSKTSNSCFQWCLKMPKASALKQASAMYRFLCSRELKCMLAELFQTKVV